MQYNTNQATTRQYNIIHDKTRQYNVFDTWNDKTVQDKMGQDHIRQDKTI